MKIALSLAVSCFLLSSGSAFAGWYHVENFTGTIGPYPIHFSVQTYDDFGSGITAEGSYYYDAKASPIALYGTNKDGKFALCEVAVDDKNFDKIFTVGSKTPVDTAGCAFALDVADGGATGTWHQGTATYPVALKQVALLDNTEDGKLDGTVEIPFWTQTANDMFMGVYTKTGDCLFMEKLRVVAKATRNVDQEIGFDKDDCDAGTLMTSIYENVEKSVQKANGRITVNFSGGRIGYSEDYVFNAATKIYSLKK